MLVVNHLPCDVCNRTIVQADHCKEPKKIHTGDRPFVCDVRDEAFIQGSLTVHKIS